MRLLMLANGSHALHRALGKTGYEVDAATDGTDADRKVRSIGYDVILLDLDAAKADGVALVKAWRKDGVDAHIVVLTPHNHSHHRVFAISAGADDCVAKPIDAKELIARLRLATRSSPPANDQLLTAFDLEINTATRSVQRAGVAITLTSREFALLHFLATQRGKAVSRAMIRDHLYDRPDGVKSNVVDVYVRYLRKKIDEGFALPLILTCWGKGYMLRGDE